MLCYSIQKIFDFRIVPIIDELLTTEENYVKDLQLVVEVFTWI